MVLVTIGLPFWNPGPLLLDAIKSVFCQTLQDWELILVDDGSNDKSVELAKKISDPRVKLLHDGEHRGLPWRLNQIIDLARGKYIARLDADDLMHPERLERQVTFLEAHPEIDVVDTAAYVLNARREPVGVRGTESLEQPDSFVALKWGVVLHPSVVARRSWYVQNRYDPSYPRAEDRELFVRTLKITRFGHLLDPLYFYYYEGNVRVKAFLQSYRSERKVLMQYGPELIGWPKTAYLWARSIAKSATLPLLVAVNKQDIITGSAYRLSNKEQAEEAKKILALVRNRPVPGLDA